MLFIVESFIQAVPIISQTRYLEKRGELQEVNRGGTFLNLRPKFSPVYLFLFNDLLVIASKKRWESWKTCLCCAFTLFYEGCETLYYIYMPFICIHFLMIFYEM